MNINSDFINPNSEAIQFKDDIIKSMKTCHIVKIHVFYSTYVKKLFNIHQHIKIK